MNADKYATVIAFEGVRLVDLTQVRTLVNSICAWARVVNIQPTRGRWAKSGRKFRGAIRLFDQKMGRASGVPDEFAVYQLREGATDELFDWRFIFTIMNSPDTVPVAAIGFESSILMIDHPRVLEIGELIVDSLSPSYCYAFSRAFSSFPIGYIVGMNLGTDDSMKYVDRLQISRWGRATNRDKIYDKGILRALFPINYLNISQQEQKVDGVCLVDWIRKYSIGNLYTSKHGLQRWTLSQSEIEFATPLLAKSEILFR